jgi:hypothetical protein
MSLRLSVPTTYAQSLPDFPPPIEVPQPAPDVVPTTSPVPEIYEPLRPNQNPPVREPEGPGDPVVGCNCGEVARC